MSTMGVVTSLSSKNDQRMSDNPIGRRGNSVFPTYLASAASSNNTNNRASLDEIKFGGAIRNGLSDLKHQSLQVRNLIEEMIKIGIRIKKDYGSEVFALEKVVENLEYRSKLSAESLNMTEGDKQQLADYHAQAKDLLQQVETIAFVSSNVLKGLNTTIPASANTFSLESSFTKENRAFFSKLEQYPTTFSAFQNTNKKQPDTVKMTLLAADGIIKEWLVLSKQVKQKREPPFFHSIDINVYTKYQNHIRIIKNVVNQVGQLMKDSHP